MFSGSQPSHRDHIGRVLATLKQYDLSGLVEYEVPKRPVARGGYGYVYRGMYRQPDGSQTKVAIKCLTLYLDGSRDVARMLKREIRAWSKLSHPNVLPFLGYVFEETGSLISFPLISEWMDNGNILEFVKRNPDCDIVMLALDIASGLAYLHQEGVVHSDLKSANVLVSSSQTAVICDFGSAHITHSLSSSGISSEVTHARGTSRWMAYELLAMSENLPIASKASDTWSFGMTVYEMLTGGCPYAHIRLEPQVISVIVSRELPPTPELLHEGCRQQLWAICKLCWTWDPNDRPAIAEIRRKIDQLSQLDSSQASANLQQVFEKTGETLSRLIPKDGLTEDSQMSHFLAEESTDHTESYNANNINSPSGGYQDHRHPIYRIQGGGPEAKPNDLLFKSVTNSTPKADFKWIQGQLIGKGTYGNVYLALNTTTCDMITVNKVKIPWASSNIRDEQRVRFDEVVKSECNKLQDLDHPNIMQYLGFEQTPAFLNIFLEHVPGESIASCLKRHGRFGEQVARSFTGQILSGLDYLNANSIFYTGLTANNILINSWGDCPGRCKITHIGIRTDGLDDSGVWIVPEDTRFVTSRNGENQKYSGYSAKGDIWRLGCVVLEMWSGRRARHVTEPEILYALISMNTVPPVPLNVVLSPDANDFRKRCFAIRPDERPLASELREHPYLILQPGWNFTGFN